MKTYIVTFSAEIEIVAETIEEAREKATDQLCVWTPKLEIETIDEMP